MSRLGDTFNRLWPGLVVALLTAAVIGGLSGWMDLRDRMTGVERRLDAVEGSLTLLRSELRGDIAELRSLVLRLHLKPEKDAAND